MDLKYIARFLSIFVLLLLSSIASQAEIIKTTSVRYKDSAPIAETWTFDVNYDSKKISWTESSGGKHHLTVDTVYSSTLSSKANRYTFEGTEDNIRKKIEVDIPSIKEGKRISIRLKEGDNYRTFNTDIYTESKFWTWFWAICVLVLGGLYYYWGWKKYKISKSRYRLNAAPGVFTSLGILGTFISICFSLWDIDAETFEITTIINELIPAFTTSIAGMIGAVCATVGNKYLFAKQDEEDESCVGSPEVNLSIIVNKLDRLNHLEKIQKAIKEGCENNAKAISKSNTTLSEKLQMLIGSFNSQETVNRELNEKLTSSISQQSVILEKFVNDFVAKMDSIFQNMRLSIEQQMNSFGEKQFAESRATVEKLMTQLKESSESMIASQSTSISESLNSTNERLNAIINQLSDSLHQIGEANKENLTAIVDVQNQKMMALMDAVNTQTASISSASEAQTIKLQEHLASTYDSVTKHNVESLNQMVELKDAFAEISTAMLKESQSQNREMTSTFTSELQNAMRSLETEVQGMCVAMGATVQKYLDSLKENYSFMLEQTASIRSNYEQSTLAFTDAVESAHNFNRNQENMLSEINNSISNLTETNSNITQVLEIVESRQENIDHLVQRIGEIGATIEKLQELESTLHRLTEK